MICLWPRFPFLGPATQPSKACSFHLQKEYIQLHTATNHLPANGLTEHHTRVPRALCNAVSRIRPVSIPSIWRQRHSPRGETVHGELQTVPPQHQLRSHLTEGEHTLLRAHDAALQHEEVVVDLAVVRKATLWGEAERGLAGRRAGWEQTCPQAAFSREGEGSD